MNQEVKFLPVGKVNAREKYWKRQTIALKRIARVSSVAMFIFGFLIGLFLGVFVLI